MFNEFTSYIDLAQVCLYIFWAFFIGLIWWLRREDRREGYPLESDNPRRVGNRKDDWFFIPPPKVFIRPDGTEYHAPDFERDTREIAAERSSPRPGAPLEPTGDPMLASVGPGSYAQRADEPELTREGHHAVVPMKEATEYSLSAGPDPRGWDVVGADGEVAGQVSDIWVDRAEMMVRYLEVTLAEGAAEDEDGSYREQPSSPTKLIPLPILSLNPDRRRVEVGAIRSEHFARVPDIKAPDSITLLEEELISAFYAGGRLYADPKRAEPFV